MRTVSRLPFPDPTLRDAKDFGRAVRAARTAAGIRAEEVAEALGISKSTLTALESGAGTVALSTALRVAREMGVALLAAPLAAHFEAARGLQRARQASPEDWGGPNPDDLPPVQLKRRKSATRHSVATKQQKQPSPPPPPIPPRRP